MKVVKSSDKQIKLLIGIQSVRLDAIYRYATFVLYVHSNSQILLHNTLTGEILLFDNDKDIEDNKEVLIENYYLVPSDFDEIKTISQLRSVNKLRNDNKGIFSYNILPTTCCNARCSYCYEKNINKKNMTLSTAEDCVKYIIKNRNNQMVNIGWFGGEPLMGINIIDYISNRLLEENIPFDSTMITNGFLFNTEIIRKACKLWNLKKVQITLDGTEEVYNKIKNFVDINESAFNKVLNNIDELLDNKIRVRIRLNMDSKNAENIEELIDYLGERYSNKKGISVYVAKLFEDEGLEDKYLKTIWYEKLVQKLRLNNIGGYDTRLSKLTFRHCMADNPNHRLINPDGKLGKCEHFCEEKLVGSIYDNITDENTMDYWKESETNELCDECPIYPSCIVLKNCHGSILCDTKLRTNRIEKLKESVLRYYELRKNN